MAEKIELVYFGQKRIEKKGGLELNTQPPTMD
jgi:hypothetical protein